MTDIEQKREKLMDMFRFSLQTNMKSPTDQFTINRIELNACDCSIEQVATEFLKIVDFSKFEDEKSLSSCATIGDN